MIQGVIQGALGAAEITGKVPVFHPDVRVYRVTNKKDGSFVGILYRDDFARQYKRSGAWQDTYRTAQKVDGVVHAIASNNNNFVKGAKGEPVLISLEVVAITGYRCSGSMKWSSWRLPSSLSPVIRMT